MISSSSYMWTKSYIAPFLKQQERAGPVMIHNIQLSKDVTSISLLELRERDALAGVDQQTNGIVVEEIKDSTCSGNSNAHYSGADARCSSSSPLLIPLTINGFHSTQDTNSYTVSPFNHFITYGWEELWSNPVPLLFKLILSIVLYCLSLVLKWTRFDRVVIAGNYMLSTSLHCGLNDSQIESLTQYLRLQYPDRAIVIRSVNDSITNDLKQRLQSHFGYKMIMSRVIYWSEPMQTGTIKKYRSLDQDLKLLQQQVKPFGPYIQKGLVKDNTKPGQSNQKQQQRQQQKSNKFQILDNKLLLQRARAYDNTGTLLDATNPIITRCEQLYNMLYLQKYSKCNVQFSSHFLLYALENNIWQFRALENIETGTIDGIIGYYMLPYRSYSSNNDDLIAERPVMTVPLLGYDTSKHDSLPLYRLLSSLIALEGAVNGAIVNQSSGASKFKMFRSCSKSIEYMAVYDRHLPWYRRFMWTFFSTLLSLLAAPIVLKYDL